MPARAPAPAPAPAPLPVKSGLHSDESQSQLRLLALASGALVLVHAFLLPYRAACTAASWGDAAYQPARELPAGQLAGYCLSLYIVDCAFVGLRVLQLGGSALSRARRVLRELAARFRLHGPGRGRASSGDGSEEEEEEDFIWEMEPSQV